MTDNLNGICTICQFKIYMPWVCVFGDVHEYNICEECEEWLAELNRDADEQE